jgi:hypothetical protein
MPRLELISRHLASGAGCNARPLLLVTQEDFLSPPVCIGSKVPLKARRMTGPMNGFMRPRRIIAFRIPKQFNRRQFNRRQLHMVAGHIIISHVPAVPDVRPGRGKEGFSPCDALDGLLAH